MMKGLKNQKGVTMIETMAMVAIIAVAMLSLYAGILYADKQVQRNYHDRVATLHASGELDWQTYYRRNYKEFDNFSNRAVVLDKDNLKGKFLYGYMSTKVTETFESPQGTILPYSIMEVSVSWQEPGDKTPRKIVVREDFYY